MQVNCSHWPSGPALTAEEIPPFGSEGDIGGATADVSLTQPLLNDTSNVSIHNTVLLCTLISVLFPALYRLTVI